MEQPSITKLTQIHSDIQSLHFFLSDFKSEKIQLYRKDITECMSTLREILLMLKDMEKFSNKPLEHHSHYTHPDVSELVRGMEESEYKLKELQDMCESINKFK